MVKCCEQIDKAKTRTTDPERVARERNLKRVREQSQSILAANMQTKIRMKVFYIFVKHKV